MLWCMLCIFHILIIRVFLLFVDAALLGNILLYKYVAELLTMWLYVIYVINKGK